MSQSQILIVHPESSTQSLLASMLQSLGHGIEEAANDRAALRRVERGSVGLVISAVDPADPEVLELTSYVRRKHPRVPILLLFANPACDRAREATRLGATVLRYPAPAMELRASVTQALQVLRDSAPAPAPPSTPATRSPQMSPGPRPRPIPTRPTATATATGTARRPASSTESARGPRQRPGRSWSPSWDKPPGSNRPSRWH